MLHCYNKYIISIHSLVKRETVAVCASRHLKAYFNPLPRKEGDLGKVIAVILCLTFQSTPS